jgi:hypothetical protein
MRCTRAAAETIIDCVGTAARLAALIWIKSCALPTAVIEDGWHRVAVMT